MALKHLAGDFITSLLVLIIFVHISNPQESSSAIFTSNGVRDLGNYLSTELDSFFKTIVPYVMVKNKYQSSTKVTYKNVDGRQLVDDMAMELGIFLGKKVDALRESVKKAENVSKGYPWNPKLKTAEHVSGYDGGFSPKPEIGTVEYVNSKLLKRGDPILEYNPRFKQPVNMTISSVHIPVEIYEGNIDILNGLQWTAALDSIFIENREKDPDLLWQFFGSQSGFMRTFPASRWRCNGEVDLYDVRRRPWYTQGSSSPKDMIILIDASGSVHGQALQLIKVAVQSLLDTLGDNDFFNIIKFSADASYVHDCFNHTFVQANYRNKKILQDKVGQLQAKGKADFGVGLSFAFEQFIRFRPNETSMTNDTMNHGANCNEVIMLLTDGGSDKAKEVFEKYNWPNNKSVRVFTYTIGSPSDPTDSIRWMACANRGFYSPIPAMGAIRSKVQAYMNYLKRGKEYLLIQDPEWHTRYQDMGLGMLTTVTLPVYNRSQDASNQTILGVMGMDVTTDRLMEATPSRKLTPNGYSFAINRNGYIIFHPELKAQSGWLKDPPNVDFLDLEYETDDKLELRKKMIDGLSGEETIMTFLVQADEKHIVEVNRKYFFTSIDNSDFSLGIVIPEYAQVYPDVTEKYSDDEGFALLEKDSKTMLIPLKPYYKGYDTVNKSSATGTVQDLLDARDKEEFDEDLKQLLFWDADMTQNIENYFKLVMDQLNETWEGVLAAFIGTSSGLTRVHHECCAQDMMDVRDTWNTAYYKRALDTEDYVFIAPPTGGIEGNDTIVPTITMVKAITINTLGKLHKPAVFGIKMEHQKLLNLMAEKNLGSGTCNDSDSVVCYLLDDGGFVIATNQIDKYAQVGHFFGTVDNTLMQELVNDSRDDKQMSQFYHSKVRFDYQASCPDEEEQSSFAGLRSIRIPTLGMLYEVLSFNFWSSQITWAYVNFNIYNWLWSPSTSSVYGQDPGYKVTDGEEEAEEESDCTPIDEDTPTNHSCTKYEAQYYFTDSQTDGSGTYYCENCTRSFFVRRITGTNLLLVVADIECDGDCQFVDILQAPREDKDPDDCILEMRYRKRPEGCYSQDDAEDDTMCGSVSIVPSSLYIICLAIITLFYSRRGSGGILT